MKPFDSKADARRWIKQNQNGGYCTVIVTETPNVRWGSYILSSHTDKLHWAGMTFRPAKG